MVTNESKKHKQGNSHEYIGADCKKDYLKRVNHEFSDNHDFVMHMLTMKLVPS